MSTQQAPALNLETLLRSGAAAARSGNRAAARALFLALSHEHPDDARVWLGLAAVADDEPEQRAALERALALDPGNERARQALARLDEPAPGATVVLPETLAPAEEPPAAARPPAAADEPAEAARSPFPLLNLLALLLILILLAALGLVIGQNLLSPGQTAAAPTVTPGPAVAPGGAVAPTPPLAAPTAAPAVTAPPPAPTAPPASGATPPASETAPPATAQPPAPAPTASTELPLGQVIDYDGWTATLLRPDYAVALDGAIGDLQPAGRFVLAVVAVSNNAPAVRPIPPDLFTLVDSAGRSYQPAPGASTAYLALYGRGQRGDLALEDPLDAGSGMRSVPLLFDVPLDATGLRLTMAGSAGAGWPIGGGPPPPVGP